MNPQYLEWHELAPQVRRTIVGGIALSALTAIASIAMYFGGRIDLSIIAAALGSASSGSLLPYILRVFRR